MQVIGPLRQGSLQLFGDPSNPAFPSLKDYGDLADNPVSRERIGTAVQLLMKGIDSSPGGAVHAGAGGVGVSTGGLVALLQNWASVPSALAKSEQDQYQKVLKAMTSRERDALDSIMAAFSTVVGLRSLTRASAAQFSTKALEREVPVIGAQGVTSSRQFYNKLAQLAEEIKTGTKGRANIWEPGELEHIKSQPGEMLRLRDGGKPTPAGTPAARKITVTAPDGSTHDFKTQAEADAFKKLLADAAKAK